MARTAPAPSPVPQVQPATLPAAPALPPPGCAELAAGSTYAETRQRPELASRFVPKRRREFERPPAAPSPWPIEPDRWSRTPQPNRDPDRSDPLKTSHPPAQVYRSPRRAGQNCQSAPSPEPQAPQTPV